MYDDSFEFLKNLGGYNESFTCQDGYDLWIKFIMHHKVTNINRSLFSYRRHGSNLTTNEERILETRKKIKDLYIESHQLKTPSVVAVIPVRNTRMGKINWPLHEIDGKSVLELAIEKAAASERIQWVVVTSSDDNILTFLREKGIRHDKLLIIPRPEKFERVNESLNRTFELILDELAGRQLSPEAILSISLEYPFLTKDVIDDSVNTLTIFKSDSLLSVRPDNRMYYQHIGHGMVPILDQEKFTKLEREALYKGAGGVVVSTVSSFRTHGKMVAGKVGHIVVDQKTALSIQSEFDVYLAEKVFERDLKSSAVSV